MVAVHVRDADGRHVVQRQRRLLQPVLRAFAAIDEEPIGAEHGLHRKA